MTSNSFLPLFTVLVPMVTGIALYCFTESKMVLRKTGSLLAVFFSFGAVIMLLPLVLPGSVCCDLIEFMQFGLSFNVDLIGWLFAFLITLIWLLATLFSFAYMEGEHNLRRYYSFLVFTLGAILGVVFAADFFTLFIFFEIMTFSSFVLVIHKQDREAMQAGSLYLYLAITGGLALLFAILLLFGSTGSLDLVPMLGAMGARRTAIFILFLIGFGIKAGLVPLHIWLPLAHPVAPSPASALLSGIMIKAGAYGILRVTLVLFNPTVSAGSTPQGFVFNSGYILMWMGIITMLAGAVMALLQSNTKRLLAYSSISQMGFIVTGLGVAVFMGTEGALGFAGSVYHMVNHAIFKAGLFIMVGLVYMHTHELDISRLGGLGRKMPLLTLSFLVAALGIAGIPGFNGYAGKTLIHDALLEAHQVYGIYGIYLAERLFVITSALTICYIIKLYRGVFMGPVLENIEHKFTLSHSSRIVIVVFPVLILGIGLFPNLVLEKLLMASAGLLGFSGTGMEHLAHFNFFDWHPLQSVLVVVLLAVFIYLPATSRGWFDWEPPRWLSVRALLVEPLPRLFMSFFLRGASINDMALGQFYEHTDREDVFATYTLSDFEQFPDESQDEAGQSAYLMAGKAMERERRVKAQLRVSTLWNQEQWNIKNLNFDNLLLAFVLGVILFIVFSFGG